MAAVAPAGPASRVGGNRSVGGLRPRLLTVALLLPASAWYLFLLVVPLAMVVVFSVGHRGDRGGYTPGFTTEHFGTALRQVDPFVDSLLLATAGTIGCLLVGLPLAYWIATRAGRRKGFFILLLVIPFWTSFLIRTFAWTMILDPRLGVGFIQDVTGVADFRLLGTQWAVLIGLIYGYLPLMIFPVYVTLERMDRTLVEASKDLGAGRWATFRQVTLPIALPGLVTGSILVFIPMMGEYVIPFILGYGRTFLVGNALVLDFLEARNWPAGSAKAVLLIGIMLITVSVYLWFINRGRKSREASVL